MSVALFLAGLLILIFNLTDFFFTTLSGNGSGVMTNFINRKFSGFFARHVGRKGNKWSGLLHLVFSFANWILLLLLGSFLIFYSYPDFVLNADTRMPASAGERLYFTGFVLTTLGVGDYVPGTFGAQIFTILLSITGFVTLTTALTYLISVSNSVTQKKNLATFVAGMGESPAALYRYATAKPDLELFLSSEDQLLTQLDHHTNNHLSFPIVHHFLTDSRQRSAAVQLANLHETLTMLLNDCVDEILLLRLNRIKRSLLYFLEVTQVSQAEVAGHEDIERLRQSCLKSYGKLYHPQEWENAQTIHFTEYLYSAGWSWSDVYLANSGP